MVLTYKECIEKYGSDHLLKKEISEGRLFQKEKGIYSLQKSCSELEIIMGWMKESNRWKKVLDIYKCMVL